MPETSISQADIDGLAAALDGLDLPPGQRALLSAIVGLAARVVGADVTNPSASFGGQFASAFTPGQADLVVNPAGLITRG